MFTDVVGDKTTRAGDLIVVLTPGRVTAVGLAGLEGSRLVVVGTTPVDGEVFRSEQSLASEVANGFVSDWSEYFFSDFDQLSDALVDGIPPFQDITLSITIEGASTACGVFAFGRLHQFGTTQLGATIGISDYSTKETNELGVVTFAQGPFSRRFDASILVESTKLNRMQSVLTSVRANPTFWSLTDGQYQSELSIFGFYRDFSIVIAYPKHFLCSIEIEGLI